jgi:hypothetical protein
MDLPAGLLTRLCKRLKEPLPVLVILENRLPPVAPIHDVIDCPRILDAQLPSHEPRLMSAAHRWQENITISGLTPAQITLMWQTAPPRMPIPPPTG